MTQPASPATLDTPRTKAARHNMGSIEEPHYVVDEEVAAQLERELAATEACRMLELRAAEKAIHSATSYSPTWSDIDAVIAKYSQIDIAKRMLELEHAQQATRFQAVGFAHFDGSFKWEPGVSLEGKRLYVQSTSTPWTGELGGPRDAPSDKKKNEDWAALLELVRYGDFPTEVDEAVYKILAALASVPSASVLSPDAIDAARYRYLRKYGWDLITLPPTTKYNDENAASPKHLDELCDLGRK